LSGAPHVSSRDGRWSTRLKLEARRQSCVHSRLGHCKKVARRHSDLPISVGCSRGRHSIAVRSRPDRSMGARFGSRLQRSARSIFPVAAKRAERHAKLRSGSTYRRRSPDKKRHPATGERVRGSSRDRSNECVRASLDCKIEDQAGGRRPEAWLPSRLTARREFWFLARRSRQGVRRELGALAANVGGGALAVAPSSDRGRQRLRHAVRLPQPKGAGGR
jgi:hypothetical protein